MHHNGDVAPLCRTSRVGCNSVPIGFGDAVKFVGANFLVLAILAVLLAPMLGCGGGSAGIGSQVTPPSNLTYPQTNVIATVGVAISADTPTVGGTVASFTVSPALPAGLSLSTSSGTISGNPSAQSAQATYTVTASNSAGSTTAKVQITVSMPVTPPSNLAYPQTTLTLEVGQPFASDIPAFSGAVTAFSVSPTLPAGLSLDQNTGAIYGVASASASSNTYEVKASNAGGNSTATLTLSVKPALMTLLDLGSVNAIKKILTAGSDVLTLDSSGHWALIDYKSNTTIASGEQGVPNVNLPPIQMAGSIFVVAVANGLEVRSTTDGHLLSIISFTMNGQTGIMWWQLASDGSYICAGSKATLTAWSSSGTNLISRTGDYSTANAYAAPAQVLLALGPAGQNVIETVSVASGSSSVGPTFFGNFNTWFTDGKYFLTNLSNSVWTYDTTSTLHSFVTFPASDLVAGGWGGWVWTVNSGASPSLSVYPLGSSTPSGSYSIGVSPFVVPSGSTIGLIKITPTAMGVGVIDLSGTSPVETNYAVPTAYNQAYGAFSGSQWMVGNIHGSVVDGASLSSTVRYLSQGTAFDIAGGNSTVAVAVANGHIYVFDPASTTPQEIVSFDSSHVAISSDGTVVAGSYEDEDAQYHPDETLNVYALPAGSVTKSWPYQIDGTSLFSFSLATSGNNIGQATGTNNGGWHYVRQVTPVTGGPVIWADTPSSSILPLAVPPPLLSPDGDLIAAASDTRTSTAVTTIYQNGTAVGVPGFAVGWIDETHLLVNTYIEQFGLHVYNGCTIYSPNGTPVSSPPLPEIKSFQTVSPGLIYTPDWNAIHSTSTGAATWTSSYPYGGVGATTGTDVVFLSGARVVVQTQ